MKQSQAPCYCRPEAEMDICRHADSSAGCPRHDRQAFEDHLAEALQYGLDRIDSLSDEEIEAAFEPYCDYCERDGHTFRSCPQRDDSYEEES